MGMAGELSELASELVLAGQSQVMGTLTTARRLGLRGPPADQWMWDLAFGSVARCDGDEREIYREMTGLSSARGQMAPLLSWGEELLALAMYDFLVSVCDLPPQPWVNAYLKLAKSSGGWGLVPTEVAPSASSTNSALPRDGEEPLTDVMIVQRRPCEVHRTRDRWHREGGPALRYPDGYAVWALNGVSVPQWLAEPPVEQINLRRLVEIQNADSRREFVRKVGIDRIAAALATKLLDTLGDYELLDLDLGDDRCRPYLKMRNPSLGCWHLEGVDPSCLTVREALAWRNETQDLPKTLT